MVGRWSISLKIDPDRPDVHPSLLGIYLKMTLKNYGEKKEKIRRKESKTRNKPKIDLVEDRFPITKV